MTEIGDSTNPKHRNHQVGRILPSCVVSHSKIATLLTWKKSRIVLMNLKGKGTIKNSEFFNRSLFRNIDEVDITEFEQVIDAWTIEYAEQYAAKNA